MGGGGGGFEKNILKALYAFKDIVFEEKNNVETMSPQSDVPLPRVTSKPQNAHKMRLIATDPVPSRIPFGEINIPEPIKINSYHNLISSENN